MSNSSLSTAALQSTANFKRHITAALKQKDFYIFFINLGWLLRLTLCNIVVGNFSSSSSSCQFISLLFSQHKKLNDRIKTTSEKGMQVTKRIDVKHTQIF